MASFLLRKFIKQSNSKEIREQMGVLSGTVGIFLNLFLFGLKITIGLLSQSMALISDAFNNFTDMGSSIINILGSKLSNKPADKKHPYGHGRFEYVSTLIVSAIILYVGIQLFMSSIDKIIHPKEIIFSSWLIIILIVSLVVKLWMYFFNLELSEKINSGLLKTIALDSLSDCLATIGLIVAIAIEQIFGLYLDGYASLIISILILITGYQSGVEVISVLLGQRPNLEIKDKIEELVANDLRLLGYHDLQVHDYGPSRVHANVDVELDDSLDLTQAHAIIDDLEMTISQQLEINLSVHIDPISSNNQLTETIKNQIDKLVQLNDLSISLINFRCITGNLRTTIMADVLVNDSNREQTKAVVSQLKNELVKSNPTYLLDVQFIEN
ncbi:MAG: cation transporter [Erysipelothrix sp.]|nr:cation transporter [Erysipelothrix sp.]